MKPTSPLFSDPANSNDAGAPMPRVAMVFAAGLGTRMRPVTDVTPKPLVKIAGRSLIDRALDDFARAGVATAIVNVHHLADQIETHLATRAAPHIEISDERELLLDQGGGIKKVLSSIGADPFFVCNTDAFWHETGAANLRALAKVWDSERMDAALLLAPTRGSVGVDWDGDFDLDDAGRIVRREGPKPFVYAGVGIIKPQLFESVEDDVFKLAPFLFTAARAGRLFGVPSTGLWLHVGTVAAIDDAERRLAAQAR